MNILSRLYDHVTRIALNMVDPYVHGDHSAPSKRVWPYLRSHLHPLRWVVLFSVAMTIVTATIEVWLISFAGRLIDMLIASAPGQIWNDHAETLIIAAVLLIILRPLAQFWRLAMNDIALQCNAANLFRWRAHDHLTRQSVGWFQEDLAGKTASRLVLMGNYATDVVFHSLNAVAFGAVYMVGVVAFMVGTDIRLAAPLLLWLGLYFGLMIWIVPRVVQAMENFMATKSSLLGRVVDVFSNFDTVNLFATRSELEQDHRVALEKTREKLFYARKISVGMRTVTVLLESIIIVGFVGYGIWLWSNDAASIGLVSAAVALSLRITTLADWVMEAIWSIFQQVGSVREALQTLSQPLAIPYDTTAPNLVLTKGEIKIEGLGHHYGNVKGGLDQIDLTIAAGEKIGLVGPSGAGKSTLVNLILRFHAAERGRILIDGQDLAKVHPESLGPAIGMVSQQAALLNRSVAGNIALGQPNASQSDIEMAAKKARAHDFILDLKDSQGRGGYEAHVGERGVKLSGGQRQRIALARVILKNAPIMILDEATSALDSSVEAEIQQSLLEVMDGKTVIAIAHRLSTVTQLDRIIVLEDGRIVEQGKHETLLKNDGLYRRFWARQSGASLHERQQS